MLLLHEPGGHVMARALSVGGEPTGEGMEPGLRSKANMEEMGRTRPIQGLETGVNRHGRRM